jgi:signal transduction histidine kinase
VRNVLVPTSLVHRVAWGAALSACVSALIAAFATCLFAVYMLQHAEDRRLTEAALVLVSELQELEDGERDDETVRATVLDEIRETEHSGVLFEVFAPDGRPITSGESLTLPVEQCELQERVGMRACRAAVSDGITVVCAAVHIELMSRFVLAAFAATLLAGALAWLASRPISNRVIAPLSRLRARLTQLDVERCESAELGANEGISEVDQLRATIAQLLGRVARALGHATRFAADAAHELRTPLTSVRAELELLAEDAALAQPTRENLRRAHATVEQLGVLVERLLILAMPRSASMAYAEAVSLRDVVDDVLNALPEADRIRVQAAGDADATVRGDATLLQTLFANALSNALKFGRNVEVEITKLAGFAVLYVGDDGPGVPLSERDRMFEPFVRAQRRGPRVQGHGIGLTIIAHIAQSHGGSVAFVDTQRGARLEVRRPRLAAGACHTLQLGCQVSRDHHHRALRAVQVRLITLVVFEEDLVERDHVGGLRIVILVRHRLFGLRNAAGAIGGQVVVALEHDQELLHGVGDAGVVA